MRYRAVSVLDVSAMASEENPTDETLMLREHIRRILRKLSRARAELQYS
ncbi:hypothetical protein SAMN02799625_04755 [Methylobacterium sp. UNC300MFChir4.1]|jgi:hypothetical protein|nr:hypothetical protein SAMN04488144_12918 [Methylobacterium sp. 190mf]SEH91761.1 hypothetical protein SAMN02799636_04425 [Methylobacterium sp. 275MFSha3.1]SEP12857.1 hypothetical protein SAMN02799625_04755 [Methylobacterium sp. UNC300MFChir4.1]SFF15342.1 hypothetical protein SAMN02799627_05491 [Methylobacterium sp. 13MFTsu3.1M2]SFT13364.1 hypothetical protein SAMN04487845_11822 [Methylobacterium sp. yr668]